MCSGLTVYSAIRRAGTRAGMEVGVVGIGNLGHLAVQILSRLDCEVTAFSHSKRKESILKRLGVNHFVSSISKKSLEREKGKYDLIFFTSIVSLDWPAYIEALKPQGNLVFVGLPIKNISFPAVLLADYAQRGILGSYIGSRAETRELLNFATQHSIKAVIRLFPMNQLKKVVSQVKKGKIPFSVVLKN
jgi:uncharacterized zinc-type alcohol dehydrogenase-like protein